MRKKVGFSYFNLKIEEIISNFHDLFFTFQPALNVRLAYDDLHDLNVMFPLITSLER